MSIRIKTNQPGGSLVSPREIGFDATTHLAIGAHSDDLEIMAYHGIAKCYESKTQVFSGITVTNGVGSPQQEDAKIEAEELRILRQKEQLEAAQIGKYGFIAQLDYSSNEVKNRQNSQVADELFEFLERSKPDVVYLHQPGDKHPTHLAVLQASMEALQRMKPEDRPANVYGCEVWRDLDWLADDRKVYLETDYDPALAQRLISVFQSQIRAGVSYDLGTLGRRIANATFADPHKVKDGDSFTVAIDLMPVVRGDVTLQDLVLREIDFFRNQTESLWGSLLAK